MQVLQPRSLQATPEKQACDSSLSLYLELPTSACKKKRKKNDGRAVKKKKHVLPLLSVAFFFLSQLEGMKRNICMEFWARAHCFGMSDRKMAVFFHSHGGKCTPNMCGWDSVSVDDVVGFSIFFFLLRQNEQFLRVSSVVAAPGETLPTCLAI